MLATDGCDKMDKVPDFILPIPELDESFTVESPIPVCERRRSKKMKFQRRSLAHVSRDLRFVYDYELTQFSKVTNLHGMGRWKTAKSIGSKLFWSVLVIAVVTFSICQVVTLISLYASRPTLSQVRFVIPDGGLQFPVITVCNYSPVKDKAVFDYKMNDNILEYLLTSYMQPGDLFESYTEEQMEQLQQKYETYTLEYKNMTGSDFNLSDFFWNAAFTCEETFLSCSFGGLPFNCCQFAEPVMTDMGKCYRFREFGHNRGRQLLPGSYYGFQALINSQKDHYPLTTVSTLFEYGIRVSIQQSISAHYITTGSYAISPGFKFIAGLVPSHFILLSEDQWGTCKQAWPEGGHKPNEPYSATNCRAHCEAEAFMEKCNCVPLRYYPIDTGREDQQVCDSLQLYKCTNQSYLFTDEEYWKTRCSHCVTECDRWTYSTETSYVSIPSPAAVISLPKRFNMDEPTFKTNVLALSTYFTEIAHTEHEQSQATTLTQTFSDIGGTLGLFIGFSVVTFFELTIFVVKLLWGCMSKERRRSLVVRRASLESLAKLRPVYSISSDLDKNSPLLLKRNGAHVF